MGPHRETPPCASPSSPRCPANRHPTPWDSADFVDWSWQCLRPWKHTIYLSRHGESEYNVLKLIGGDSPLSPRGKEYALSLGEFVHRHYPPGVRQMQVWTSTLRRTRAW